MKPWFSFLICLWANSGQAQITITNSTFPSANDTLRYAVNYFPSAIQITPAGGPYSWNFVNLKANESETIKYRPANQGAVYDSIKDANLVVNLGEGRESYYKSSQNTFELIGIAGKDPLGIGLNLILRFVPPIIQQRAPLKFPANNVSSYSAFVPVSLSNVPKAVLDSLNLPFALDSIRIRVSGQRNDFVDAYGSLIIPGGTFQVLREKRTEIVNTRLDAKLPLVGWQDITDFLLTNPAFDGLGKDTSITYFFWSNTSKEAIAMVYVDVQDEEPYFVRFKNTTVLTAYKEREFENTGIHFSPNPFSDDVEIKLENSPVGQTSMTIINSQGHIIEDLKWYSTGFYKEHLRTEDWPPGIMMYHLKLADGKVQTGKLIKLN